MNLLCSSVVGTLSGSGPRKLKPTTSVDCHRSIEEVTAVNNHLRRDNDRLTNENHRLLEIIRALQHIDPNTTPIGELNTDPTLEGCSLPATPVCFPTGCVFSHDLEGASPHAVEFGRLTSVPTNYVCCDDTVEGASPSGVEPVQRRVEHRTLLAVTSTSSDLVSSQTATDSDDTIEGASPADPVPVDSGSSTTLSKTHATPTVAVSPSVSCAALSPGLSPVGFPSAVSTRATNGSDRIPLSSSPTSRKSPEPSPKSSMLPEAVESSPVTSRKLTKRALQIHDFLVRSRVFQDRYHSFRGWGVGVGC